MTQLTWRRFFQVVLLAAVGLIGCQKHETALAPEPPVHNALTQMVDNGVTGMNKAQSDADAINEHNRQTQEQTQAIKD